MGITYTTNGAKAVNSTNSKCYDLFALGGAYRQRSDADVLTLFKEAFKEDMELAMKTLFWLRDVRGGAGERRFFRICMKYIANNLPTDFIKNMSNIVEMGRWDDIIDIAYNTCCWEGAIDYIKQQLIKDIKAFKEKQFYNISLCAKWLPSENASSQQTKIYAKAIRKSLNISSKEYRQTLSKLRKVINIVERDMSANNWNAIDFSRVPSKANMKYQHCFSTRPEIKDRYTEFLYKSPEKINAAVLYPYDIVKKIVNQYFHNRFNSFSSTEMNAFEAAWKNLPDYFNGKSSKMLCVVDTSGSMYSNNFTPLSAAIGLGMYCAERNQGYFHNKFMTFNTRPNLVNIDGNDNICTKVIKMSEADWGGTTNLEAAFDILLQVAKHHPSDVPEYLTIISDMQINAATGSYYPVGNEYVQLTMNSIRDKWTIAGIKMPKLIYWNVNAIRDTILDLSPDVTCVSGMSPVIFKSILTGKTGYQLFIETVTAKRYENIWW